MDSQGVYRSKILFEFFLKPVYPTTVVEKFQIYSVKITGRHTLVKKMNLHFCSCPQAKLSQTRKLPISPEQRFLEIYFPLAERGGDMELYKLPSVKMTRIKLARILVTSFNKFHHLYNLYIFGFCSVVP